MIDPYVYSESGVLKNRMGIKKADELAKTELVYTTYRLAELVSDHSAGCFHFAGLCQMHFSIFQDLYEWAGKPRTINIEKAEQCLGGISIEYTDYKKIEKEAGDIICKMEGQVYQEGEFVETAKVFGAQMAKLWKVHPFREGNTRTIITFCCKLAENKNLYLDNGMFYQNIGYVRNALVAASASFQDLGDRRQPEHLEHFLKDALTRGDLIKQSAIQRIRSAGLSVSPKKIRELIDWDRAENKEHSTEEIKSRKKKKSKTR